MSIPKWRYVESTDDGCNVYQCLSCYESYEGRDSPKYWKYCPYCGVEWNGEHEWLIYDDDYNILEPARRRKNRRVSSCLSEWHMELQERSLFKCDDGAYVPLHENVRWSGLHDEENLYRDFDDEHKAVFKAGKENLRKLIGKYGHKYGCYIYYKQFAAHFLKTMSISKDIIFFTSGSDYRLHLTLWEHFHKVIDERSVDLGGWRENKGNYSIREPNTLFEGDDLDGVWQDHMPNAGSWAE